MKPRSPRLGWLPPLLVGASAAIAAEVALAMLLYGGPGLVRSLTTILAVGALALSGGLWSAPSDGPDLVDRLRVRWLLCLFAFLGAALFGSAWSIEPLLGEARWGQAAGLVMLMALPLYAAGAVLGGMAVAASTDVGRRLRGPGSAAATGAALGFVLTGLLLPRVPMPASMLVACLIFLSLGGMVFGAVLGARTETVVLATRESPNGQVRVLERRIAIDDVAVRELWEGDHLRRSLPLGDEGAVPWDAAVGSAFGPREGNGSRALVIGGGASALPRTLLREHPGVHVDVAERTGAVIALGREHFDTGLTIGAADRTAVSVGNLDDLVAMLETTYDLVVVDLDALAPVGGGGGLTRATHWRLRDAVRPGGRLVLGPVVPEGPGAEAEGWVGRTYRRAATGEGLDVLIRSDTEPDWPRDFEGFVAT